MMNLIMAGANMLIKPKHKHNHNQQQQYGGQQGGWGQQGGQGGWGGNQGGNQGQLGFISEQSQQNWGNNVEGWQWVQEQNQRNEQKMVN